MFRGYYPNALSYAGQEERLNGSDVDNIIINVVNDQEEMISEKLLSAEQVFDIH